MYNNITDDNFIQYAEEHYHNPQCVCYDDFLEDINRIKYIKRLLNKYKKSGIFRERLLLNHVIMFYNVFDHYPASRILFTKIDEDQWGAMKSILDFLGYMPRVITGVDGRNILSDELPRDEGVFKILESL